MKGLKIYFFPLISFIYQKFYLSARVPLTLDSSYKIYGLSKMYTLIMMVITQLFIKKTIGYHLTSRVKEGFKTPSITFMEDIHFQNPILPNVCRNKIFFLTREEGIFKFAFLVTLEGFWNERKLCCQCDGRLELSYKGYCCEVNELNFNKTQESIQIFHIERGGGWCQGPLDDNDYALNLRASRAVRG